MRAFASSFYAWKSIERQEGIKVPHGLVFSLAVVEAIGRPHGLQLTAEERDPSGPGGYDAVFLSVLDSRCMINAAAHFARWNMPLLRVDRASGLWPLVWAGGQGLANPLPLADIYDLCVVGDAEDPLPELLRLWETHGNSAGFLTAASTVPGVFVPSLHHPGETRIQQSVATDIRVTLRDTITVSHDNTRRVEIARGCRYKCTFCSLGWRAPLRENSATDVVQTIRSSGKRVHLQAGDAESHSGIDVIRGALREHGGSDTGWTGRLDSLLENPDQTVPGQKRYAFGVEGISHRLRNGVGKGYLTDERLIADTCRFFDMIGGSGKGRAAWHVIAGLPTERTEEVLELCRALEAIDKRRTGKTPRNLSIHWQPFQPLPGTPAQWCAAGSGARALAQYVEPFLADLHWCRVRQLGGRTDPMALVCTVLSRCDASGGSRLLAALGDRRVTARDAVAIAGVTAGALDPDAPLPWDFLDTPYPRSTLHRAYGAMMRRFGEAPHAPAQGRGGVTGSKYPANG